VPRGSRTLPRGSETFPDAAESFPELGRLPEVHGREWRGWEQNYGMKYK